MNKKAWLSFAVLCVFLVLMRDAVAEEPSILNLAVYDVPDDQTIQMPQGTAALLVDKLTMGKNSKLVIAGGTEKLTIRAKQTIIQDGSVIVGRGNRGDIGNNGDNGVNLVVIYK